MKKLAILVAVTGFVLAAPMALAGDYHQGVNLVCSDCHTMHYSQQHTYAGADSVFNYSGTPHAKLLKAEPNDLCLTCHDGNLSAPDVVGANASAYVREAGALNKTDGTGDYAPFHGHTLGTTDAAPGGTWSNANGLSCGDCHSTHGATTYRNIRRNPGGSASSYVTWDVGTNSGTKDVYEVNGHGASLADHYGVGNVWFNETDATGSKYATYCKGCHTLFHGNSSSGNMYDAVGGDWLRHPTAGADLFVAATGTPPSGGHDYLTGYKTKTNHVKVLGWDGTGDPPSTVTPSCMTCHKAHGNKNPFGLIFMSGATGTTENEEGDTGGVGIRDLCRQCHSQGTAY